MKVSFLLLLVHLCAFNFAESKIDPVVRTKHGLIEGTHDGVSRDGRPFYQFRGIQYAVIKERFKPARDLKPWNGIRLAKEFGPTCSDVAVHGKENCLFLNVFTPSLSSQISTLLPVTIFIHGGCFQFRAGENYGPNYLIDENVVFVTFNYRLGVLGFMSTEDEASPGNYGLKDQVMAMKWVQDNILAFGGDKHRVTLMGQSAGAASVTFHLVSPMSKGLFHYGIAQSGTFLDPWAFSRSPLRYAKKLAEKLNCINCTSTRAIVDCLKSVPVTVIAQRQLLRDVTVKFLEDPFAAFGPTIEQKLGDLSNSFLTDSPFKLLMSGNVYKVPLLIGVVKEEGIYLWASHVLFSEVSYAVADRQRLKENFNAVAPAAFYFDEKAPFNQLSKIATKIENFYFGSSGYSGVNDSRTFQQLSKLYSDRLFVSSAVRFMNMYSKQAPTYPYLYTFDKFVSIIFGWEDLHKKFNLDATHGAELDVLVSPLVGTVRVDPVHDKLSKSVTKLWASFMKHGVPTATFGSEHTFAPIDPNQGLQKFYRIDVDTELVENIFSKRIAFWDSLNLSDNDFKVCYC